MFFEMLAPTLGDRIYAEYAEVGAALGFQPGIERVRDPYSAK